MQNLTERFKQKDRGALARAITLVERGQVPEFNVSFDEKAASKKTPIVIGITGSGGAGKSTFVGALVSHLRTLNLSVAVLAYDPTSPLSGGALLGDRIRLQLDPKDSGIFFRSMSTHGASGGVAENAGAVVECLSQFGFDVILLETVGVGQDQIAAKAVVDTLALLVTPNTGDEIQWEKAGLIELADLVIVNKADLPGADRVKSQLTNALSLSAAASSPPIFMTTATTGQGVPEVWEALANNKA